MRRTIARRLVQSQHEAALLTTGGADPSLDRWLLRGLEAGRPYDLLDDLKRRSCRAEAISTFLAVLELARLNLVRLHQTAEGDIVLYRTTRELGEIDLEAIEG